MERPGTCRSCGARVLWVRTERGRLMPLDQEPSESGSVIVRMGHGVAQATAHVETMEERAARLRCQEPAGRTAYVPHWETCPQAAAWRKPRDRTM